MKRLLKLLANPKFAIYHLAKKYIVCYEGFGYTFEKNGEERLLDTLANANVNTIFDVGANVGGWTKVAARKFPNAHVHSFEISQRTFRSLQQNHIDNNRVTLNNFGLSNEKGEFEYKDYGEKSPHR